MNIAKLYSNMPLSIVHIREYALTLTFLVHLSQSHTSPRAPRWTLNHQTHTTDVDRRQAPSIPWRGYLGRPRVEPELVGHEGRVRRRRGRGDAQNTSCIATCTHRRRMFKCLIAVVGELRVAVVIHVYTKNNDRHTYES